MRILVTGASGFIGSHLVSLLLARDWQVRGAVRSAERLDRLPAPVEGVVVGELGRETDWSKAVAGVDVAVHLAARVHVMRDTDPTAYARANVEGSRRLAEAAAAAGVKRLVFVSSVKAMGEADRTPRPWREEDPCRPQDEYGRSKLAAERAIAEAARLHGMETVVLRPPVVYGPGVTANIFTLFRLVDRGWPLPLGSVDNRRSLIYVGNLVHALVTAAEHPKAAGETFLVSDGQDLSTPELIRAIGRALGKSARLFPLSPGLLRGVAGCLGRSAEADRLLDSLVVDSMRIRRRLGWEPPVLLEEGLARTAEWYSRVKNSPPHP